MRSRRIHKFGHPCRPLLHWNDEEETRINRESITVFRGFVNTTTDYDSITVFRGFVNTTTDYDGRRSSY